MTTGAGRCLCGAVRYKFDPDAVLWTAYCHCDSCQRATSSPVAAFFGVRASAWRWHGDAPAQYRSSAEVLRSTEACPASTPASLRHSRADGVRSSYPPGKPYRSEHVIGRLSPRCTSRPR